MYVGRDIDLLFTVLPLKGTVPLAHSRQSKFVEWSEESQEILIPFFKKVVEKPSPFLLEVLSSWHRIWPFLITSTVSDLLKATIMS